MDPNYVIQMILGVLLPFVMSTFKNPASIAKLKSSLPAIIGARDSLNQLITAIQAKPMLKRKKR